MPGSRQWRQDIFVVDDGVVTVYEGRREFKALKKAARRSGLPAARVREYLPYRMLEVEVAANTLYTWAAEEILARRLAEERPADPADYASAVRREAQALRYRAHDKLMRASSTTPSTTAAFASKPRPHREPSSRRCSQTKSLLAEVTQRGLRARARQARALRGSTQRPRMARRRGERVPICSRCRARD